MCDKCCCILPGVCTALGFQQPLPTSLAPCLTCSLSSQTFLHTSCKFREFPRISFILQCVLRVGCDNISDWSILRKIRFVGTPKRVSDGGTYQRPGECAGSHNNFIPIDAKVSVIHLTQNGTCKCLMLVSGPCQCVLFVIMPYAPTLSMLDVQLFLDLPTGPSPFFCHQLILTSTSRARSAN